MNVVIPTRAGCHLHTECVTYTPSVSVKVADARQLLSELIGRNLADGPRGTQAAVGPDL